MLRAMTLALFSTSVLAHPGHGALEIHWHLEDILWAALGAAVLVCVGLLIRKALKR